MLIIFRISVLLLLSISISFSDTKQCDNTTSNAEYTLCLSSVSVSLENELQVIYKEYLAKHIDDKIYQTKIKTSQALWKRYREAELEMAFPHSDDSRYYWTGLNRCYLEHKINLTQLRILLLKTFDDNLERIGCSSLPID